MAKKDTNECPQEIPGGEEKKKEFVPAQEKTRKRINTTVAVIVVLMAVVGIAGMALRRPDTGTANSAGSAAAAATTQTAPQEIAAADTDSSEIVAVVSEEKSTDEPAVAAATTQEEAQTETSDLQLNADGTYTLPADMNVYASADENGQAIAQLYAGNQVLVGQNAGNGWYAVTVWVGSNGTYAETAGYMKLQ